jgi:hypothetical protein
MIRKILRNIAKTRMQQEGMRLHQQFKRPVRNSHSSSKQDDRTLFAQQWRTYAKKGVIPLNGWRRRTA